MIERRAGETGMSYVRLRLFLESEDTFDRRLTAEWLAGRLRMHVRDAAGALDALASEGVLRRHTRPDGPTWFEIVPTSGRPGPRRLVFGAVALAVSVAAVALSAMLHHVFYFALGLGLGLLIAVSWLDWELRSRVGSS